MCILLCTHIEHAILPVLSPAPHHEGYPPLFENVSQAWYITSRIPCCRGLAPVQEKEEKEGKENTHGANTHMCAM